MREKIVNSLATQSKETTTEGGGASESLHSREEAEGARLYNHEPGGIAGRFRASRIHKNLFQAVYFLSNWKESKGACMEYDYAFEQNKGLMFEEG